MAIANQPRQVVQTVYVHKETRNQSFIDMFYYLTEKGIENNTFFLILYDRGLAHVDPHDKTLPLPIKVRVLNECRRNYWYFLREVVRIPIEGRPSGTQYNLHRANLAMNFLYVLNYNQFVEMPRQFGKTIGALCRYLWCYQFGTTNSEIMFLHKNHDGSKGNLRTLKNIRDLLPDYLRLTEQARTPDGKLLRVPNTVETMSNPVNKNRIVTFASARSKIYADNLGRGCTQALQYYDEFAFMMYNDIIYAAATPANSRASENAKLNGAPYGICITTTPNDITTEFGAFAYSVRNNATAWNEMYYNFSYQQLEGLRQSNHKSPFFLVSYTYQQLGAGNEYFNKQCVDLLNDWFRIRREVLLEWPSGGENGAFAIEDLDTIETYCREPIRTILLGKYLQYQFEIFEEIDLRYPPIIGVDVSGAMYQDSSAITIIDSRTTRVCATLNCNFIPSDDLADVLYTLVNNCNMKNAVINIERNGGFGISVIQRLVKTNVKHNLYYEIKDRTLGESSSGGGRVHRHTERVKVYGLNSTKDVRARLIELLYDRVRYHKDKFISKRILDEMRNMEVKKSGKVEHSDRSHDDQVFSYLMALYVWYEGVNLVERYGIQKNTLKTDENLDVEVLGMDDENGGLEKVDIDSMVSDSEINDMIEEQMKFLEQSTRSRLYSEYAISQREKEDKEFMDRMSIDPLLKQAYMEKYHIDQNEMSLGMFNSNNNFTTLPDELFGETEIMDDQPSANDNVVGAYADTWRRL